MTPRRRQRQRRRRGFTLMLVIIFLLVLLSMLGVAYRQMATTMRLEEARTRQIERDRNGLRLAALGLTMLEGDMAATSYTMEQSFETVDGPKTYRLTMQRIQAATADTPEVWQVAVSPE